MAETPEELPPITPEIEAAGQRAYEAGDAALLAANPAEGPEAVERARRHAMGKAITEESTPEA